MKKDNNIDLDSFISKMQKQDFLFLGLFKGLFIMLLLLLVLYSLVFVFKTELRYQLAGTCYVISFSLLAYYIWKYYMIYKKVNYSDTVKKVLQDAEARYRKFKFKRDNGFGLILAVLLINAATLLMILETWNIIAIIAISFVFWGLMTCGFLTGLWWWKKDSKPIWLAAKALLKELEE